MSVNATWSYSMTPVIPGLSVVADAQDSRIATIVGSPEQPYSGLVTIGATDGTQVITQAVTVDFTVPSVSVIASLEFGISWVNQIQFAFNPTDSDLLRLMLQFEFKEQIPIAGTFTPTIVFGFEPIVSEGPLVVVFEPRLEVTFTPTTSPNNGS